MVEARAGCEFDVQRGPEWLLVRVRNLDLDPANPPPLADEVWELAQRHFIYRIVLELDDVQLLDSHLVGELIRLYEQLQEHDGLLRLCGLSPRNRRVLCGSAVEDRFPTYETRQEAVMGGCDPRLPR
ncbi:MAG: STAS domain-containing protein [Thermoguttaceae bacterium]|jgi:anti-anti-sigma factor